jgi:hypothetical protein
MALWIGWLRSDALCWHGQAGPCPSSQLSTLTWFVIPSGPCVANKWLILNHVQSLAHWGSSAVTGRGLIALVGQGQVYSVELKDGEQYVAHPRYVTPTPSRATLDCSNMK